jgi:hypothetical protein
LANVPLRAFACDPDTGIEIVSPGPVSAGESIAACIRYEGPDGYNVAAVYSAYVFGGPNNVNRTLFNAGMKEYSLANVDCTKNGMCVLETNLDFNSFFSGSQPSTITLSGVAILQLGRQRRLQDQNPPELLGGDFRLQYETESQDVIPISDQLMSGGRRHVSTIWVGSLLIVTTVLAILLA